MLAQRLTFPFPFVHHQSHDWKVEQLLTLEPDVTLVMKNRKQERYLSHERVIKLERDETVSLPMIDRHAIPTLTRIDKRYES